MKKDGNRISLTIKEADEIREYLETLYAMEGTLDEDFNSEYVIGQDSMPGICVS